MNEPPAVQHPTASETVVPAFSIQVWLARVVVIAAAVLVIGSQFFGEGSVSVRASGDSTIYTAHSPAIYVLYALPALVGLLAVMFVLQHGTYRLFGLALGLLTAWLSYAVATIDTSNHNVTVTPHSVTRQIGSKVEPIRQTIDFTTTAFLYIDEVPGDVGANYELVAIAEANGAETRISIFDMMRPAVPQIFETAAKHGVAIGPPSPDLGH